MPKQTISLKDATHVFTRGFAFVRSRTHPFLVEDHPIVTVLRDAPRRSGRERNSEFVACQKRPAQVLDELKSRKLLRGVLCAIDPAGADLDAIKNEYKSHGMLLLRREAMFALKPADAVITKAPSRIARVRTKDDADAVFRAARCRQILEDQLQREDTIRLYAAFSGRGAIGFVSSVPVGDCAWVSNLYVDKAHRRKGVGGALMSLMLEDDKRHGVKWSVLAASAVGAMLYPTLGYEQIGVLQVFMPSQKWRDSLRSH